MSLFVISDTHLSLQGEKPMDIFGDRWKKHTEKLENRWRSLVTAADTVVIPGDISWAMDMEGAVPDLEFIDRLPGRKIILKGNHDFWWQTTKKNNEALNENGIKTISFLMNDSDYAEGFCICGSRGWYSDNMSPPGVDNKKVILREAGRLRRSLTDAEKKHDGCEKLVFLHFPPVFENFCCQEIVDVLNEYNIKRVFYGHIHGRYDLSPAQSVGGIEYRIVSADYLDFYPRAIK